jgi:hypothetical protein
MHEGAPAHGGDLGRDRVRLGTGRASVDDHGRPVASQPEGHRPADAPHASGHERHLAVQRPPVSQGRLRRGPTDLCSPFEPPPSKPLLHGPCCRRRPKGLSRRLSGRVRLRARPPDRHGQIFLVPRGNRASSTTLTPRSSPAPKSRPLLRTPSGPSRAGCSMSGCRARESPDAWHRGWLIFQQDGVEKNGCLRLAWPSLRGVSAPPRRWCRRRRARTGR